MGQETEYIRPDDVDKIIEDWLESELVDLDLEDPTASFVPTRSSRVIVARLKDAVEDEFPFALVTGPAGCSKTITARYFVDSLRKRQPQLTATYLECQPSFDPHSLLEELATRLFASKTRQFRTLLNIVHGRLENKRMVAVLDEAQRMPRDSYEVLKYLADSTGSTFVLICTEDFAPRLRHWRDIESRIGVVAKAEPVGEEELASLSLTGGLSAETLTEIHKLTGGVLRDVLRLVKQIDRTVANNPKKLSRGVFTPRNVRVVAQKLNLVGGAE